MNVESASRQLAVLGSPTRLEIFRLLVKAGEEGAPVGTLQEMLGIPGSTLSHHIGKLVGVGLVSQDRESRVLRCRADYARMQALLDFLQSECCRGLSSRGLPAKAKGRAKTLEPAG